MADTAAHDLGAASATTAVTDTDAVAGASSSISMHAQKLDDPSNLLRGRAPPGL